MDYVALLTFRPSVDAATRDAALMRRAAFTYPHGIEVIAEYWPISADPNVVSVISTEDKAAMMQLYFEWSDVFDITILPAVSAADGLKIGPDVFGRLQRLQ
jgi:hypothetical protein